MFVFTLFFWIPSVSQCTLFNKALRMALKEFLEDSKESRGVLGQASNTIVEIPLPRVTSLALANLSVTAPAQVDRLQFVKELKMLYTELKQNRYFMS